MCCFMYLFLLSFLFKVVDHMTKNLPANERLLWGSWNQNCMLGPWKIRRGKRQLVDSSALRTNSDKWLEEHRWESSSNLHLSIIYGALGEFNNNLHITAVGEFQ